MAGAVAANVVDATGGRQELEQQLAMAQSGGGGAMTATNELTARDQTIGTQQRTADPSTVAARDAKLAEQESTTAAAVEAARREAAANLEEARKALLASEQTANQQAETIVALRQQTADSGARLTTLEAEQRSQADQLANLTAERDRLRHEASAQDGRLTEMEANVETLRGERDQLTTSISALRTRLTAAARNLAATEQTLADREQALAERTATLKAQRGQLASLTEEVKSREATIARLTTELQEAPAKSQSEAAAQLKAAEETFAAREQAIAEQTKSLTAERGQLEAERTRLTGEVQALTGGATADQRPDCRAGPVGRRLAAAAAAQQNATSRDQAWRPAPANWRPRARTGPAATGSRDDAGAGPGERAGGCPSDDQSDALGDEVLLGYRAGSAEAAEAAGRSRRHAAHETGSVACGHGQSAVPLPFGVLRQTRYRARQPLRRTVVGDRFVMQAEILFDPARRPGRGGRTQLAKVARTLLEVAPTIRNLPWVVRGRPYRRCRSSRRRNSPRTGSCRRRGPSPSCAFSSIRVCRQSIWRPRGSASSSRLHRASTLNPAVAIDASSLS